MSSEIETLTEGEVASCLAKKFEGCLDNMRYFESPEPSVVTSVSVAMNFKDVEGKVRGLTVTIGAENFWDEDDSDE